MKNKQKHTLGRVIDSEIPNASKSGQSNKQTNRLTYGKQNYMIFTVGVILVIIGFLLMMGGGSEDANVFQKEELFSFRRITLSPIIVLTGYGVIVYAIFKKRKD